MKILVNFLGRKGGTALYSYEMTKALVNNGAEVSAVISSKNHMIDEWKKLSLKNLHIIDTYDNKYNFVINTIKFVLFKRFSLKKILKNSDIDIMYIPCFHPWYFFINKIDCLYAHYTMESNEHVNFPILYYPQNDNLSDKLLHNVSKKYIFHYYIYRFYYQ